MASPLITASRLPSMSDNGTKPYRPSSSRGIHLPPISLQSSSNEPAEERLKGLLPPMQERLHSTMGQLSNEVATLYTVQSPDQHQCIHRYRKHVGYDVTCGAFVPLWHDCTYELRVY